MLIFGKNSKSYSPKKERKIGQTPEKKIQTRRPSKIDQSATQFKPKIPPLDISEHVAHNAGRNSSRTRSRHRRHSSPGRRSYGAGHTSSYVHSRSPELVKKSADVESHSPNFGVRSPRESPTTSSKGSTKKKASGLNLRKIDLDKSWSQIMNAKQHGIHNKKAMDAISPRHSMIFRSREDMDKVVVNACASTPTHYSSKVVNFRVALVGQKGCGKTCFTERRTIDLYSNFYEETVQTTRHTKQNGVAITWYDYGENFWQEQLIRKRMDVILLCYDITCWTSLEYLVKHFDHLCGLPRVKDWTFFVIGNKLDLAEPCRDELCNGERLRNPFLPDIILCKIFSFCCRHIPLSFVEYMAWKYFQCEVLEVSAKKGTDVKLVLDEAELLDLKDNLTPCFTFPEDDGGNITPGTTHWTPSPEKDWHMLMPSNWHNANQTEI